MNPQDPAYVERVMQALSPQARLALHALAEMQHRDPQDVLRDEIRTYVAGKVPAIDIDAAMQALKKTAWQAGFIVGRLRRCARNWGSGQD